MSQGLASSTAGDRKSPKGLPLLQVRGLKVHFGSTSFFSNAPPVKAIDGVDFEIFPGETLGLVGESGCGKSTTAKAIARLVEITDGDVMYEGRSIARVRPGAIPEIQMVFQDPHASLNPRMTVGNIVSEPMRLLGKNSSRERTLETMRLLDVVGLNPKMINRYPHEFSGGQKQRIGIARALAADPKLIICDEPTSALDVSIQAQVINLLTDLQREFGLAYLFIAHDLAVVKHIAHRVGVMYRGRIVELAPAQELFASPEHAYTRSLLSAAPIPDPEVERGRRRIAYSEP
ncbi:MAG TPA: ATP-binding cassette domain-containing protein [Pirellulaceae bacterium]|jgi:oligopeptide transport system ATP-binding protein|nr:ATP-binding cassette domain-containing protein [Pirellulaceae bacterium]